MAQVNLFSITSELVGTPYKLGGKSTELDCFSLITLYLSKRGITVPEDLVFDGHSINNYPAEYLDNPAKMMAVAVDYIASLTTEVPEGFEVAGDILFVRLEDNESLVIAGGNGTIVAATQENGITVLGQSDYKVKRVFRCPQKQ